MSADSSPAAGFGAQRHFEPDLHKLVMAGSACQSLAGAAKNTTIPVAGGTFVRVAQLAFHAQRVSVVAAAAAACRPTGKGTVRAWRPAVGARAERAGTRKTRERGERKTVARPGCIGPASAL